MTTVGQQIALQANANVNQNVFGSILYNVKTSGAKGDGINDDTVSINTLINNTTNGTIFFPPGTYLLSKQGTRLLTYSNIQRGYGLLLLNKSNLSLVFAPGAVIKMPVDDASVFNAIWVEGCDNVQIINPQFSGTGTTTTRMLEEGTGITITTSTRVTVDNPLSTNLRGCARAYRSSDITIKNGFSSIYTNEHATAHFALYTSKDSLIDHCVSYGATLDGDMFIYGGGSVNCTIQNSRAHAYVYNDNTKTIYYNTGQGIQIDSAGRDCKLINNYAYGYYYGFDFKNNSEGGTIQGNTAEKCKVGISARKGDSQTLSPINMLDVIGNTIIPNGGNGNTAVLVGTLTGPFAIALFDVYGGANIQDNLLYNSQDIVATSNFIGVIIGISDNVADTVQGSFVITGNNFAFENRLGSNYGQNQNQAVYVTSSYTVISVVIENNQFDLPQAGMLTNVIEVYNAFGLMISNNNFSDYNTTGKPVIKFQGCQRVAINSNNFGYHYGMVEGYGSQGISFCSNVSGDNIAGVGKASLLFDNCKYINLNGNTNILVTTLHLDDVYFILQNASNWLSCQGNVLQFFNKTPTTWYTNGAANFSIANNVVD
jgi:hypothetical protein